MANEHRVARHHGIAAGEYDRAIRTFIAGYDEMQSTVVLDGHIPAVFGGFKDRDGANLAYLSEGYSMISLKWMTETSSSRFTSRA